MLEPEEAILQDHSACLRTLWALKAGRAPREGVRYLSVGLDGTIQKLQQVFRQAIQEGLKSFGSLAITAKVSPICFGWSQPLLKNIVSLGHMSSTTKTETSDCTNLQGYFSEFCGHSNGNNLL